MLCFDKVRVKYLFKFIKVKWKYDVLFFYFIFIKVWYCLFREDFKNLLDFRVFVLLGEIMGWGFLNGIRFKVFVDNFVKLEVYKVNFFDVVLMKYY